jgi:hypothetical protein
LLLAACGSDSKSSAPSGGAKDCSNSAAGVVNEALGTSFGEPKQTGAGDVLVCTYTDTKNNYAGTIRWFNNASHATFEANRKGFDLSDQATKDLDDAGDEAYSSTFKASDLVPELNTVVVRKGSTEVSISTMASIAKERDLANKLLD